MTSAACWAEAAWTWLIKVASRTDNDTRIICRNPAIKVLKTDAQGVTQMRIGHFSTTPQERYLEDYVTGAVHEFGPITITEDEIVQFGKHV
jgi:hypothetical protein